MIVNVCPAAVTSVSPDRIWSFLTTPEQFGKWNDASYLGSEPSGPVAKGQIVHLAARAFGLRWPLDMVVQGIDPQRRWIDVFVRLPFGIENREHLTLTETDGGTLLRLN